MKKEKRGRATEGRNSLRAILLGLSVKKEARVQEDFWRTQKIGRALSLVG